MNYTKELNIEGDVLPLFNYTNNASSESMVLDFLKTPLPSIELVLERQHIIKGFKANWSVLENFTYKRLDLIEIEAFLGELNRRQSQSYLKLFFLEEEKAYLYSKYVQIILFFDHFYRRYIAPLNTSKFPECYIGRLQKELPS